mgnify:CR=1 FL=1
MNHCVLLQVAEGIQSLIKVLSKSMERSLTPVACMSCCCRDRGRLSWQIHILIDTSNHTYVHVRVLLQVAEGIQSLIKVLSKSMDSSLTVEKVELATVTRDDASGKVSSSNTARQQMPLVHALSAAVDAASTFPACCYIPWPM